MNKFRKGLLAVCLTATFLGGLAACNTTNPLEEAAGYLYEVYKNDLTNTGDYKLPATVKYNEVFYPVTWTVDVKSGNANNVKVGTTVEGGFITVDVVYDAVNATEDVTYTLTATITDEKGKTVTQTFEKTIPAFKFTSHAEYLKAEDDTMLNVEGYVVGVYPLSGGKTSVFLQSGNGEGYYVYNMAVTEDQYKNDLVIGNQLIVSGKKDTYNGTAEVVSATYQLSTKADVTVEPYDVTSLFTNAATLADASLANLQGSLVTVKDVTLTTYTESNSYLNFTKDGKNSYLRISSSGNCSDYDSTAKETLLANYPSKFGYKADVTGIVALYSGNFYLMPTSKDSIKVTGTSMDAAFAVDYAKSQLTVDSTVIADLPTTVEGTGTTITWASSVAGIFSADGKLTAPEKATEVTLTATITSGTSSVTKVFEKITVLKAEVATVAQVKKAIAALSSGNTDVFLLEGTVVAKDSSNRPYVMDANGDVLFVYEKLSSLEVGESVKLYGVGTAYNGLYQLKNAKVLEEGNNKVEINYGRPVSLTPAELTALAGAKTDTLNGVYVKVAGLKIVQSGSYFNFTYDDNGTEKTIQSLAKHDFIVEANVGKTVTVYGYYNGASSNGEAKLVAADVKEGVIADSVDNPLTLKDTVVTSKKLGLAAYADGKVTLGGLDIEYFQCSDYGDGLQMRTKNGKTSSFWNATAIEAGIAKVELTFNTKKHTADKANVLIVEFSNTVDFATVEETINVSYTNGTASYTVTPTGSYKYVRISHGNNGAVYLSEVVYSSK